MFKFVKYILPFAFLFFTTLINYLPYELGIITIARIDFTMLALFYWFAQRNDSCPFIFVLFLGVIVDTLSNSTLGVHTIAYMSMYMVVSYGVNQHIFFTKIGWYVTYIMSILSAYFIIWLAAIISDVYYIYNYSFFYSALLSIGLAPVWNLIYIIFDKEDAQ